VRGGIDINVSGSSGIVFGVIGAYGANGTTLTRANLGGALVVGNGTGNGWIGSVTANYLDNITSSFSLSGKFIGNYASGQTVRLTWSIDQAAHTLSIGASPGGTTQTLSYSNVEPFMAVGLSLFLSDPAPNASVYVDNVVVEEF